MKFKYAVHKVTGNKIPFKYIYELNEKEGILQITSIDNVEKYNIECYCQNNGLNPMKELYQRKQNYTVADIFMSDDFEIIF